MNTEIRSKEDRQFELEKKMIDKGIEQYRSEARKAMDKDVQSSTKPGLKLTRYVIHPLSQAIREFVEEANAGRAGAHYIAVQYLKLLEPEVIAFLTARCVVNSITKRMTMVNTAIRVATMLEDELRFRKFSEENPAFYDTVYRRIRVKNSYDYKRTVLIHSMGKDGIDWEPWPTSVKLHIGMQCLNLMEQATELIEIVKKPEEKNVTRYYLMATQKTMDWLADAHERCELLSPFYGPTIIPPKDWTTPFDGGYHGPLAHRLKLVKTFNKPYLDELMSVNMPLVYRAINRMQQTPWRVNEQVLDVALHLWEIQSQVADLPHQGDMTPPPCPFPKELKSRQMTEEQKEVFKDWKRKAAHVYEQNVINNSKYVLVKTILDMACDYRDESEIYFPYILDFRGRVYAVPAFLNPQGSDLARGLLTFAQGKPINTQTAADWLAVHGANVYGYDKVSLEERVAFIHKMSDRIVAIADDPMSDLLWADLDKPWQFLAFCFEWAGFIREGFGYMSSLPVALDGSCNGLQHFSAMLRDSIGGEAVNLLPSEQPEDIYQRVADVTLRKLEKAVARQGEDAGMAAQWLHFGVDRDMTKRPVMILPYGGTRFACRKYIEDEIRKALDKGKENPFAVGERDNVFAASDYLAGLVWDSIGEVVVAARDVMGWLRKAASLAAKEGLPVNWTSPSGLPIQQAYRELKSRKIFTKLGGNITKTLQLTIKEETDALDRTRQANGISPNFVHSMDAACLHRYVCKASEHGIDHFALIHDSYGTLAADTEQSAQCIRDVFVEMYQEDVLENFRTELLAQLSEKNAKKLPPVPPKGTLELDLVRQSAFFFA